MTLRPSKPKRSKPKRAKPPKCAECGIYRADPPSKVCPGCEAYREHQR